jgi:hypothetical protein
MAFAAKIPAKSRGKPAFRIVAKQLHQGCRFDMLQMKRVFSWPA